MKRTPPSSQDPRPAKKSKTVKKAKYNFGSQFAAARTTLTKSLGPFKPERKVTFLYQAYTYRNPAAVTEVIQLAPNDCFDPDYSNKLGNKQPLYFDTLLSATGPYKQFTVLKWKLRWTIQNETATSIVVYFTPTAPDALDIDTVSEVADYPGVLQVLLGPKGSGKDSITKVVTGAPSDIGGALLDAGNLVGSFSTSPSGRMYQGIVCTTADGTTNVVVSVSLRMEQKTQLNYMDAIAS